MVWGCMSSHGVGRLHIVSGTVKAMNYIEILQNKLLPTARDLFGNQSWIFQDDNAPCHRAKVVQKWLKDHTVNRMNWPGQSPDLNPAATAGSDVVQSGRPIFDDFFQHLWPYIGNNTANVVFQMVKRLWLIRIDQ
ncbi:transposable element Tcb1 transposase [Trichonephila clavipes]|nr:transposable element Tcb1 transposase [Trichonephila clavipes]